MTNTKYDDVVVVGKTTSKTLRVEKSIDDVVPTPGQALVAVDANGNLKYETITGTDANVLQSPISTSGEYPVLTKATAATTQVTESVAFESDGRVTVNPSSGKLTVQGLKIGTSSTQGKALVAADTNGNVTWGDAAPSTYLVSASVTGEKLTIVPNSGTNVELDVSGKADTSDLGDAAFKDIQTQSASDVSALTTKDYVDAKATSAFTYKGSNTYEYITALYGSDCKIGDVWNSTNSFTIPSGHTHAGSYPAGTNLVCTVTNPSTASIDNWDPLGGDVSTLVQKTGGTMTGALNISGGLAIETSAFRNIKAGSDTPSGGSLGDVYLQVGGTAHVGTTTVGSATQPIYLNSGVPYATSGSVVKTASGTVSVGVTSGVYVQTKYDNNTFKPNIVQLYDSSGNQIDAGITVNSTGFTIYIAIAPSTAYSWTYYAIGW